jgi:hypothetical protein
VEIDIVVFRVMALCHKGLWILTFQRNIMCLHHHIYPEDGGVAILLTNVDTYIADYNTDHIVKVNYFNLVLAETVL